MRLQAAVPDFAQWRHLLAEALDLPLSGGRLAVIWRLVLCCAVQLQYKPGQAMQGNATYSFNCPPCPLQSSLLRCPRRRSTAGSCWSSASCRAARQCGWALPALGTTNAGPFIWASLHLKCGVQHQHSDSHAPLAAAVQGASPDPLGLTPALVAAAQQLVDAHPPHTCRLREADEEFLADADRAKSFASRMKRSGEEALLQCLLCLLCCP